jgi:hypothetical protein
MPSLSRIGLGAVTFRREIDRDASFRILDSAFENGIRVIDTEEAYGDGASEWVIGEWLRSRGAAGEVSVHNKVSFAFTPDKIRQAVARSLERLGLDRIEIYHVHKRSPDSPLAEMIGVAQIDALQAIERDSSPASMARVESKIRRDHASTSCPRIALFTSNRTASRGWKFLQGSPARQAFRSICSLWPGFCVARMSTRC